jgi:hypothetical protein
MEGGSPTYTPLNYPLLLKTVLKCLNYSILVEVIILQKKTLYADLTFLVADAALLPFPAGLTVALSVLVLPPSTAQQRAHACTTAQHNNSIAIQQHSITTYQFNSTAL